MNEINQYLDLIPLSLIYILLFWLVIPQLSGKWLKVLVAILLIPVSFILTGYVDFYLPRLLNSIVRWFNTAF